MTKILPDPLQKKDFQRPNINNTQTLKRPNEYTQALTGLYSEIAFDEQRAPGNKGQWRSLIGLSPDHPLDLEIGLGNGLHFAHRAKQYPQRGIVGIELKYKPLIQSIRRAYLGGAKNALAARYHAFNIDLLFEEGEINDVFIHFPDPWTSPRKPDNRILNPRMIQILSFLQKPNSTLFFKTDSKEAFEWSVQNIKNTQFFTVEYLTSDLHKSPFAENNFITQFENIFIRKGLPIYFLMAKKP